MSTLVGQLDDACDDVQASWDALQDDDSVVNRQLFSDKLIDLKDLSSQASEDDSIDQDLRNKVNNMIKLERFLKVNVSCEVSEVGDDDKSTISSHEDTPDLPADFGRIYNKVNSFYKRMLKCADEDTLSQMRKVRDKWQCLLDKHENPALFDSYNDKVNDTMTDAALLFKQSEDKAIAAKSAAAAAAAQTAATPVMVSGGPSTVRMVTKSPPKWQGDAWRYPKFRRQFLNHCKNSEIIDDCDKWSCLHECLTDLPEALRVMENTTTFVAALEALDDKYYRPFDRLVDIIRRHGRREALQDDQNQLVSDYIEELVADIACLSDHDGKEAIYGAWFVALVKRNLPPNLRKFCSEVPKTMKDGRSVWRQKVLTMMEKLIEKKRDLQDKILVNLAKSKKAVSVTAVGTAAATPTRNSPCVFVTEGCIDSNDHFRDQCKVWTAFNVQEKVNKIIARQLCVKCLRPAPHKADSCGSKRAPCRSCNKQHAIGICENNNLCSALVFVGSVANGKESLLPTQIVNVVNAPALSMLYDSGSCVAIIYDEYAKKNKLPISVKNVNIDFVLATGEKKKMCTNIYVVQLYDVSGNVVNIDAYGSPKPPALAGGDSVKGVCRLFGREEGALDHVEGPIQLLLGSNYSKHFPVQIEVCGDMVLSRAKFGRGLVASGVRPKGRGVGVVQVASLAELKASEASMLSLEAMGVDYPPQCAGCKKCQECSTKTENLSYVDRKALQIYNDSLVFDENKGRWRVDYPLKPEWEGNLGKLPSNDSQGHAVMVSTQRRARSAGLLPQIHEVIRDMLDRGVLRIISEKEDREWRQAGGAVRYVALTYALKEGETTTPLRVCSNSSLKYNGVSTNDLYLRGPDTVNSLVFVLIDWRSNLVAGTLDVKKFYNQVDSSAKDQHLRRVYWDFEEGDRKPDIIVHETATFGDVSAGPAASTALDKTAKREEDEFPQASEVIRRTTYVDDIHPGAQTPEKLLRLTAEVSEVCRRGGFETKPPHMSGQEGTTTTLGLLWHKQEDNISIKFRLNLSEKRRGIHVRSDIDLKLVDTQFPPSVTKREVWRVAQSIYDPLGLILPYSMKMRALLRQIALAEPGIGWDKPVGLERRDELKRLCVQMQYIEKLRFPRCAVDRVGTAELLCFGDASETALAAAVYFKWTQHGEVRCRLAAAKGRAAPAVKTSIPKLELTAAVLVTRLAQVVLRAVPVPIQNVFYFTDSSSAMGQIKNETAVPKAFEAVRVSEIQHKTRAEQWLWVPSESNPADCATRVNSTVQDLAVDGPWHTGHAWMKQDRAAWPVKTSFEKTEGGHTATPVPVYSVATVQNVSREAIVKAQRSTNFTIRIMSQILKWLFKGKGLVVTAYERFTIAEELLASQHQDQVISRWRAGQLSALRPMMRPISTYLDAEVLVANLRGATGDRHDIPIIDNNSDLAMLWTRDCHELAHEGVSSTSQRVRYKFWIPQGRKLIKSTVRDCYECRRRKKALEEPMLGDLTKMRLSPTRVFEITHVDIAGPYSVRGFVRGRTSKKVWICLFVCGATSAAHAEVMSDYSSNSVIAGLVKFTNLYHPPARYVSDAGNQFPAIKRWLEAQGAEWVVVPVGGQHENGVAERLVGIFKKQFGPMVESHNLDVLELQLAVSSAIRIVNTRPIGLLKECDSLEAMEILTPAHFIRGPYVRGPPLRIGEVSNLHRRAKAIQTMTDDLWRRWNDQILPTLLTSGRWTTARQTVKVGSVCFMQDPNPVRNKWTLAKVIEVKTDRNNQVHRIKVLYLNEAGHKKTMEKSTRNVSVIVA